MNPTPFTTSLRYVTTSLSLSIFPVISTIIAPLLLIKVPQGRELLDMVSDQEILGSATSQLHFVLFLLALLAWGFANWYGSRVLLQYDFFNPLPDGTRGHRFIAAWNRWQPRVLGILGMALIAAYVLFMRRQVWAGLMATVAVVLFAVFIISRRRIFKLPAPEASSQMELLKGDRIAIWLGLSCAFVLLLALTEVNYSFARTLGSPVILFMALASVVLACSVVLAYLPLSYGLPNLAWTPFIVGFLLAGTPLTRNHSVTARVIKNADRGCDPRPSVVDDFRDWMKRRDQQGEDRPIYLVAAEGGASRSAWWTAHVLSTLDYASGGEFSRHVYAISGVSGGSLGAATFVGLLAERGRHKPEFSMTLEFPKLQHCWDMHGNRDKYPTPMQAECFLGEDFLSTTLGYMLYPDLLQRIIPVPNPRWDRSLGLEQTWQNDWSHLFGARKVSGDIAVGKFGDTLDALYYPERSGYWCADAKVNTSTDTAASATEQRNDLPLLFLNSMRAQSGRSALQAPVSIPSAELDDVFDGRLRTRGLPLSAVVHNSARFPVISPGGEVETWNGDHWDTLVDGGYFENSGAATLAELIRALREKTPADAAEWLEKALAKVRIIFIMNDPASSVSLFALSPGSRAPIPIQAPIDHEELMTPLLGLYNARSARADSSKRELLSLLPKSELSTEGKVTEVFLGRGIEAMRDKDEDRRSSDQNPSMNWYLNPTSRRSMWVAIGEKTTRDALCKVLESVRSDCARLQVLESAPAKGDR